jgi:transposase
MRARAREAHADGTSTREIAEVLGVTHTAVANWVRAPEAEEAADA